MISYKLMNRPLPPIPNKINGEDGLYLIQLDESHAQDIYKILSSDPTIAKRVTWTHNLTSVDDIKFMINRMSKHSKRYAIYLNSVLAGYIGIWEEAGYMTGEAKPDVYGFGYFVAHDLRGRNISYKAVSLLLASLEDNTQVDHYEVYAEDDNLASTTTLKKLGFSPTDITADEPTMHTLERRWIGKKITS